MTTTRKKQEFLRAGHYEIQGETIAKFEFFDNHFNPYSRYLDVDKVDLILRKREGQKIPPINKFSAGQQHKKRQKGESVHCPSSQKQSLVFMEDHKL